MHLPHDKGRSGNHAHRKIIRLWEKNALPEKLCENSRNVYNLAEINNIITYTSTTFTVGFNLSFHNATQNNVKMGGVKLRFHDRNFLSNILTYVDGASVIRMHVHRAVSHASR